MNQDAIEFLVTSDEHNQRIDKVVSSKLSEFSRVLIKEWSLMLLWHVFQENKEACLVSCTVPFRDMGAHP